MIVTILRVATEETTDQSKDGTRSIPLKYERVRPVFETGTSPYWREHLSSANEVKGNLICSSQDLLRRISNSRDTIIVTNKKDKTKPDRATWY